MRRSARSGFTLMELLIVIAIIGILAGMLFPAVNYVREKARKDECLNNLRQWGVALQGYLDEHRGRFPSYEADLAKADGWFNVLPPYLGIDPLKDMDRPPPGAASRARSSARANPSASARTRARSPSPTSPATR